ncbi:hypothetical protein O6P43_010571 [Quillaja saponaria]|uniref:Uncharacterized protein n=1 Tax=Quillaja saponaria TaxID=32244 RepID=A0AAD7Q0P4_QUISA|nr:hypothetical protein O6P43_010571 [Quillaja saponaria]
MPSEFVGSTHQRSLPPWQIPHVPNRQPQVPAQNMDHVCNKEESTGGPQVLEELVKEDKRETQETEINNGSFPESLTQISISLSVALHKQNSESNKKMQEKDSANVGKETFNFGAYWNSNAPMVDLANGLTRIMEKEQEFCINVQKIGGGGQGNYEFSNFEVSILAETIKR